VALSLATHIRRRWDPNGDEGQYVPSTAGKNGSGKKVGALIAGGIPGEL
jgi:hypothetical protein